MAHRKTMSLACGQIEVEEWKMAIRERGGEEK